MLTDQQDPSHYKLGIFYFNKNDKRIFPPKRNPALGWTINFANPYSIMAFVGILVVVFVLTRLLNQYAASQ
ncbi:hypothetical protein AEM51_05550 [Bacteroidetes bacterium UKL13-3]|jgi:uncharacterized membrane protein|nr:hypothetical protein AEM51_05550 [Bacteroidetes bacterium UKL13-3]HCP94777.1 hypothetical protein [Bacteroidota bacterium]